MVRFYYNCRLFCTLQGAITLAAKAAFNALALVLGEKGFNLYNAFLVDFFTPIVFAIEFTAQRVFGIHVFDDPSANVQHTVESSIHSTESSAQTTFSIHLTDDIKLDQLLSDADFISEEASISSENPIVEIIADAESDNSISEEENTPASIETYRHESEEQGFITETPNIIPVSDSETYDDESYFSEEY